MVKYKGHLPVLVLLCPSETLRAPHLSMPSFLEVSPALGFCNAALLQTLPSPSCSSQAPQLAPSSRISGLYSPLSVYSSGDLIHRFWYHRYANFELQPRILSWTQTCQLKNWPYDISTWVDIRLQHVPNIILLYKLIPFICPPHPVFLLSGNSILTPCLSLPLHTQFLSKCPRFQL